MGLESNLILFLGVVAARLVYVVFFKEDTPGSSERGGLFDVFGGDGDGGGDGGGGD